MPRRGRILATDTQVGKLKLHPMLNRFPSEIGPGGEEFLVCDEEFLVCDEELPPAMKAVWSSDTEHRFLVWIPGWGGAFHLRLA